MWNFIFSVTAVLFIQILYITSFILVLKMCYWLLSDLRSEYRVWHTKSNIYTIAPLIWDGERGDFLACWSQSGDYIREYPCNVTYTTALLNRVYCSYFWPTHFHFQFRYIHFHFFKFGFSSQFFVWDGIYICSLKLKSFIWIVTISVTAVYSRF